MPMDITKLRSSIPALSHVIYLNSGASAPTPRPALDAIQKFLARQAEEGPFAPRVFAESLQIEADTRAGIASAIGAAPEEITLCNNTTDGLNLVGAGVNWKPGDEVITFDQEHASGLLPWFYLRDRFDIRVRVAAIPPDGRGIAERLEHEIGARTRLVCVSHASWCTGLRLPIVEIAEVAHRRGAAVLVDGAQGPGHLDVDVKALGCDFYALSGQKWLMGPHGVGGLYVSSEAVWTPHPSRLGWASGPHVDAAGRYTLFPDGRRFESATINHGLLAGFREVLNLYQRNEPAAVWARILALSNLLEERLRSIPSVSIVSPRGPELSTGLLSFRVDGFAAKDVVDRLWKTHKILCRNVEPDAIRASVHIFNTETELAALAEAIRSLR